MIVNQNEICFDFEEDTNQNELIQQLMLNPGKYREFKRNINRVNNVDNEINMLKSQSYVQSVDYAKAIQISKEEFEISATESNDIINSITEEQIIDIVSHKNLVSSQKHILEIFFYLIGFEYFDWRMIRDKLNLFELKERINKMSYDKFNMKRINTFLNKICQKRTLADVAIDTGMNLIYEWSKSQLKIILFLYQNGLIKVKELTPLNVLNYEAIVKALKEENAMNKSKKNDSSTNIKPKKKGCNEMIDTYMDDVVNMNSVGTNMEKGVLMTALPDISRKQEIAQTNQMKEVPKKILKKSNVVLKGFNFADQHQAREEMIMKYLPLLKNKTFQQMRKYYEVQKRRCNEIEKRNMENLKPYAFKNDNKKILNMLGSNKIEVLDKLPYHKLRDMIDKN